MSGFKFASIVALMAALALSLACAYDVKPFPGVEVSFQSEVAGLDLALDAGASVDLPSTGCFLAQLVGLGGFGFVETFCGPAEASEEAGAEAEVVAPSA